MSEADDENRKKEAYTKIDNKVCKSWNGIRKKWKKGSGVKRNNSYLFYLERKKKHLKKYLTKEKILRKKKNEKSIDETKEEIKKNTATRLSIALFFLFILKEKYSYKYFCCCYWIFFDLKKKCL